MISGDFSKVLTEPVPSYGVYVFPLLSPLFCEKIIQEAENYELVAKSRGLPIFYRHDSNLGSLEDCGFAPFLNALTEAAICPVAKLVFPELRPLTCRHVFITRNWVGRTEEFKKHKDKAEVTLNICLTKENGLGSTVSFFAPVQGLDLPDVHPVVLEYEHKVGYAVLHTGQQWHKTNPIKSGTRSSMIVWADQVKENS